MVATLSVVSLITMLVFLALSLFKEMELMVSQTPLLQLSGLLIFI